MADKYVENILKLWNLELLIPKFRAENIDSEAFKYLDSSMISKLIPVKDFKMMFKSKYEQYKTQVLDQTKAEEVDLTIEDVDDFKPKLELQSSSFDIEFILQESLAGKDVMNSYEATGRLDYDSSSSLVNILIYYLISQSDDFSIDNNVLNEIADAIVTRFPTEKKEKYYYCIGEQVKGGLVDCYYIVRKRLLRKERRQRKQSSIDQDSVDGDIGPNPEQGRDNETPKPEWVNVDGKAVVDEEMVDVKWASHVESWVQGLPLLLTQEKFVDTTIVCEGQSIKCHKVVLSSYSSYFDTILESSPSKHPVVVLADLEFWEVQAIINFMYMGELRIEEHKLPRLVEIAKKLKVKGLSNINMNEYKEVINIKDGTADVDQEVCNNQPLNDPLSFSPSVSTRKRRKQNVNNVVQPIVTFPTVTTKDNMPVKKKSKYFQSTLDTYREEKGWAHFPLKTEKRNKCKVCATKGIRSETPFICECCKVSLHIDKDCFKVYHTKFKY